MGLYIHPMLRNYIKTAFRSLRNNKTYTVINITGLAVSLAVSMLLLLWVNDELSYDRFHARASDIYKLAPKFDDQNIWNSTPAPIAVYAKKEVPEVEDACRIRDNWDVFFGNEDPINKVLKGDDKKLYRITGVMKDMPDNSSIHYNIVLNGRSY